MMLGELISRARQAKTRSQTDLGAALGLSQSHISRIEDDLVGCSTTTLAALARELDLDLGAVLEAAAETEHARKLKPAEPEAA